MKKLYVFLPLCLALACFAGEQQNEYEEHKNFTIGQRIGTIGLNIIPGLGSVVIMDDWAGAGIQLGLFAAGAGLIASQDKGKRSTCGFGDSPEESNSCSNFMKLVGVAYFWGIEALFNIVRSATYDNPKYIRHLSEKYGYENFTIGQRFGTFGLNIVPGLGSIVVMDDWAGAITQWALIGTGIALGTPEIFIFFDVLFNIYRSSTYNKSANIALGKHEGFHLSVLPNRNGEIMPYLLFNKAF